MIRSQVGMSRTSIERGVRSLEALLDPVWDELVVRQACPNPTLLGGWQRALGRHAPAPLVATVRSGEALAAAGAFGLRRFGRLSVAAWLGGDLQSFSPDILADDRDSADALVDALLGAVDVVRVPVLADGWLISSVARLAPWATAWDAPGSLVSSLPLPMRNRLRSDAASDQRRADRAGIPVEIRCATAPDETVQALERLFRLHRRQWASRRKENNAHFATTRAERAIHRDAVAALAQADRVRLIEVFEEGQLVASNLALRAGHGALGYLMATQPGRGLASPGRRALLEVAERLAGDGCTIYDIGGSPLSADSPKARLKPERVRFVNLVVAASPRLQRPIRAALHGKHYVRELVRIAAATAAATHSS